MTDHGWPDPARPGVPLNPERDGWHWMRATDHDGGSADFTALWGAGEWVVIGAPDGHSPREMAFLPVAYLGICHTSAEVAARIAEAEAKADDPQWDGTDAAHPAWWRGNDSGVEAVVRIVNDVLDGKPPGTHGSAALTALVHRIAEAEARGREAGLREAAGIADAAAQTAERGALDEWGYSDSTKVRERIYARKYEAERLAAAILARIGAKP